MITIRRYNPDLDYQSVKNLYVASETFGGQFDETRDGEERLAKLVNEKPDSILVAESNGEVVGTVTVFEDGRSAWLYRFAVRDQDEILIAQALYERAQEILRELGHHTQVLVYAPTGNIDFENRYTALGFKKGNNYTAYWQDID